MQVRSRRYLVNEIFYSIQGEGCNAGIPMVFVRFAKCNLACSKAVEGFDCDTDFAHGVWYDLPGLITAIRMFPRVQWVLFTGGEPALQIDSSLVAAVHELDLFVAIETNGTRPLPDGIDWVCCSPKFGHLTVLAQADEWKFVMAANAPLPRVPGPGRRVLSPRFDGDAIDEEALRYCIKLVKANPSWRLSVQQHKAWAIR